MSATSKPRYTRLSCLALGALLVFGCTDDGVDVSPVDQSVAPDMAIVDDGIVEDAMVEPDAMVVLPDMAPPQAQTGWVLVDVAPRRPVYTTTDTFTATAEVFDVFGDIANDAVRWSIEPASMGVVDDAGAVEVRGEGQGFVVACAADICGRAGFFADNAPPTLIVAAPEQNARLVGFAGRNLTVRGQALDTRATPLVHVNGEPADVDEDGQFVIDLTANFGINRVVVTADDSVHAPVRIARDVMWAPRWEAADAEGVDIPGAMSLRLDQTLLDADAEVEVPAGAGPVQVRELAAFVSLLMGLVDGEGLLGDPQVVNTDALALRIAGVSLGEPVVDIGFTAEGIELFIRLPGMRIRTEGQLTLEGDPLSLEGSINASMVAFAQMGLSLGPDGEFIVEAGEIGVAVEDIVGEFENPTVEALLSALGSQLNAVVRGLVLELVEGVVRDSVPAAVQTALGGILTSLERLPLNIDLGIEGLAPVRMELRMTPAQLAVSRRARATIRLDGRIVHTANPPMALHPDPGVPYLSDDQPQPIPGGGLGLSARLALINALLHEVWRGGLLRFQPPLPMQFAGLLGEVRVDAEIPPIVSPAPADFDLPLVADVVLRLTLQPDGLSEPHVFSLLLRAGIGLDITDGRFGLELAETPILDAALVSRGDGMEPPLGPEALATFIEAALWPEIQAALAGGLDLDLSPVDVPVGGFFEIAPRVESLSIGPAFDDDARIETGRVLLEGALQVNVTLAE
ncbi:MAG: hypothetical protein ACI9U2_001874 [Bradymonadia bacterium]|jgi:hypothetical protein